MVRGYRQCLFAVQVALGSYALYNINPLGQVGHSTFSTPAVEPKFVASICIAPSDFLYSIG